MDSSNPKFIDIHAVCDRTCLGKTTLLQWEAEGLFPKAIRLSSHKRVWLESQVSEWMISKSKTQAGEM
jgi:predicted DNA-binding transcriptional regulator AlpA